MNEDLQLAFQLADVADEITLRHFQHSFAIRTKSDQTPVSEVDEAVERAIIRVLQKERPDDVIVGEEFGTTGLTNGSGRRWIIDPIDATSNYIRGIPVFATLIALDDEVGVISAPALKRRWSAARGRGAVCNGSRIRVSDVTAISEAHLGYDSVNDFEDDTRFVELLHRCKRTRAFGDFWTHMLVAEGAMEIAIEPKVSWWDVAAVKIIVEEAGGRFTTLNGEARADGGSGVSTNARLHDEVLAALAQV
jgi:histidinol-phosphatase